MTREMSSRGLRVMRRARKNKSGVVDDESDVHCPGT